MCPLFPVGFMSTLQRPAVAAVSFLRLGFLDFFSLDILIQTLWGICEVGTVSKRRETWSVGFRW